MAYFARTSTPRRWLKVIIFGVAWFMVLSMFAFFTSAGRIRALPAGAHTHIGLGSLHLMRVEKSAAPQGYTLTVDFYKNMAFLLAGCFIAEAALLWLFARPPRISEDLQPPEDP